LDSHVSRASDQTLSMASLLTYVFRCISIAIKGPLRVLSSKCRNRHISSPDSPTDRWGIFSRNAENRPKRNCVYIRGFLNRQAGLTVLRIEPNRRRPSQAPSCSGCCCFVYKMLESVITATSYAICPILSANHLLRLLRVELELANVHHQ
jgi:hypothetical protein